VYAHGSRVGIDIDRFWNSCSEIKSGHHNEKLRLGRTRMYISTVVRAGQCIEMWNLLRMNRLRMLKSDVVETCTW
jgi:hypothetical protein